ncbi:MAG: metallophosphoesterase [Patescibacteria group bacterium]
MPSIFIFVLLIIQIILFCVHFLIYKTIESVFLISNPTSLFTLKIVLGIFSVSFIVASIIASRYYNAFTRMFYTGSSVWLGFVLYLFFAVCVYWLAVALINFPLGMLSSALLGKILFSLAIIAGVYGLVHAEILVVNSSKIHVPNMPFAWQGKKVVWISDVHLGQIHGRAFSEKIVEKVNELRPDIIFIGGDLYDGEEVDIKNVTEPFSKLNAPWGTYFITGNHEEFSNNEKYLTEVRNVGITTLNNEKKEIQGVSIIGVDYKDSSDRKKFEEILRSLVDKSKPNILLKHVPFDLDIAEKAGINIQLSGHTHRAQMWPLSFITKLVYKGYDYGLKPFGNMMIYTSDGVGTWGPPLRVGTNAEILLIEF